MTRTPSQRWSPLTDGCWWSLGPGGISGLSPMLAAEWSGKGRVVFLGHYVDAEAAWERMVVAGRIAVVRGGEVEKPKPRPAPSGPWLFKVA